MTIGAEDCGSGHKGFGGVLTCQWPGDSVCARCYAASGGGQVHVGDRVGLMAAFAVGEGNTQKAMKAFQGGTTDVVGGNVQRVTALFGRGPIGDGEELTLQERLDRTSDLDRLALFAELRSLADAALEDTVAGHHLEILWRRLCAVHGTPGGGVLLDRAQRSGSALVDATAAGGSRCCCPPKMISTSLSRRYAWR